MANFYTQLHVQLVFAVKGRQSLIPRKHKESVNRYITGIVQNRKHKILAIENEPDHIHIFIGWRPNESISDLAKIIKNASNEFINAQPWMPYRFQWQRGGGAFSYCRREVPTIIRYIRNQQEHHRKVTFREEYLKFLREFEIEFKEEYLLDFIEDPYSIIK